MIASPDRDAAERATKAMLAMDKIEIDSLEEAFNGD
jgi:predicted 3-demethylubiquinone-9 3-methyltransferase (glyoxalase superfamily)